ncbi:MAG TPA: hypothetical protein VFS17_02265 [Methylophilaceae bacterium]|nr:hypothetical protein [Methylophilaceae bacterium]
MKFVNLSQPVISAEVDMRLDDNTAELAGNTAIGYLSICHMAI